MESLRGHLLSGMEIRMSFYDKLIPQGYKVEETDERLDTSFPPTRHWTKTSAERFVERYPPTVPSWRYVVERKGWFHWEAVPYQNRLKRID